MSDYPDSGQPDAATMETKYCSNCKRDIAASNFIMHEVHCRRNIALCRKCQEPVPKTEMENHFEEYHKLVTCKCGEVIEISKLEEHEEVDCVQRSEHCEYCELELPFSGFAEHLSYCESRTERCPECNHYIQNRDRDRHKATKCAFPEQKRTNPNPQLSDEETGFLEDYGGVDETTVHARVNRFAMPQYVDPSSFLSDSNFGTGTAHSINMARMIPSKLFYRTSNMATQGSEGSRQEKNGESRSRKQRKNQDRVQNMYKSTNQTRPVASKKKDSAKPSNTSAADQLEADRLLALRLAFSEEDVWTPHPSSSDPIDLSPLEGDLPPGTPRDEDFLLGETGFGSASSSPRHIITGSPPHQSQMEGRGFDEAGVSDDVILAPCEFCGTTFPLDELIMHQSGCELNSFDHMFDPSQLVSAAPSNNQRTSRQGSWAPTQTPVLDNLRRPNTERLISPDPVFHTQELSDEGSVMLPCEFCGDLLPSIFLPHHQFHCKDGRCTDDLPSRDVPVYLDDKPPSPSPVRNSRPAGKANLATHQSPTRERNTRRRQEDVTARNMLFPSDPDSHDGAKENSSSRQSLTVKGPSGLGVESSLSRLRSRTPGNVNSRTRGSSRDELTRGRKPSRGGHARGEDDEADLSSESNSWLHALDNSSLSRNSSSKILRSKPTTKKFNNSDYANDNLITAPSAFLMNGLSSTRPLNKKRLDSQDSFHQLLSQYESQNESRAPASTSPTKANSGRTQSRVASGARNPSLGGYVPSFGAAEGGGVGSRMRKMPNLNRHSTNFPAKVKEEGSSASSWELGFQPHVSTAIPTRSKGVPTRQTSKGRPKATRKLNNPPS